jgi:PAS domain S-box-containing protein
MATMDLIGSYNYSLVALSVLIAMFASYAALDLAGRVTAAGGWTRAVWLLGGAAAMGTGIWSMHYIGMLAFILPIPVAYHWPTVLLSWFAAILASVIALYIVSRQEMGVSRAVAGSSLMGAGIASMHYIGMAAMRLPAMCQFNSFLVILSVVFAVLISLAALWIAFHFRDEKTGIGWEKLAGAAVMGAGISVMHYTGMAAASFMPSGTPADLSRAVSISTLGAAGIAVVTFIVLGLASLTSWMDRRYVAQTLELQEEKLQRSEAYLAEAQRLTHTGSWASRLAGDVALHLSEEWYRIYCFDPEEGMSVWKERLQRIHPEDRVKWQEATDRAIGEKSDYEVEVRLLLPGGTIKYIHTVGHPVFNAAADLVEFVGSSMDITERKRAEEALRRAQADLAHINRVSMMGELAASLAHELKQPITAALMDAKTCVRWLRRDPPDVAEGCDAALRMINDAARAAEVIDRVRSLYRRDTSNRELLDANEIIREMIILLREKADLNSVSIRTEIDPGLPLVTADRIQLQQVLMNLMLNGIEAMKDAKGELAVTSTRTDDGQLLISVSDSGVGLPGGELDRIFEAYFTTKEQGTGMGLSISRRIIESHGGSLWASANPERGATFQFTLPTGVAASPASAA